MGCWEWSCLCNSHAGNELNQWPVNQSLLLFSLPIISEEKVVQSFLIDCTYRDGCRITDWNIVVTIKRMNSLVLITLGMFNINKSW